MGVFIDLRLDGINIFFFMIIYHIIFKVIHLYKKSG